MKRLLSYFFPQPISHSSSFYNHDIAVRLIDGAPALVVNGVIQSGAGFAKVWRKVFHHFHIGSMSIVRRAAVIGVGGGDVLRLLSEEFPWVSIAAVDIDKKIIDIARKYFIPDTPADITFYAQDAQDFVRVSKKYDYIVIDMFIGNEIPLFLTSRRFLAAVKKRLEPDGVVLINFLKASEVANNGKFQKEVKRVFRSVSTFDIAYNRFFLVTNR